MKTNKLLTFFTSLVLLSACEKVDTKLGPDVGPYDKKKLILRLIDSSDSRSKLVSLDYIRLDLKIPGFSPMTLNATNDPYNFRTFWTNETKNEFTNNLVQKQTREVIPGGINSCKTELTHFDWNIPDSGSMSRTPSTAPITTASFQYQAAYKNGATTVYADAQPRDIQIIESAPVSSKVAFTKEETTQYSGQPCTADPTTYDKFNVLINKEISIIITLDLADFH